MATASVPNLWCAYPEGHKSAPRRYEEKNTTEDKWTGWFGRHSLRKGKKEREQLDVGQG
jgi:hypothetical protein